VRLAFDCRVYPNYRVRFPALIAALALVGWLLTYWP
jgi:hypothetical protein